MKTKLCVLFVVACATAVWAYDFVPNSQVRLQGPNAAGVPVRSDRNDTAYVRWPNGTEATVIEDQGRWLRIEAASRHGWTLEKYAQPTDPELPEVGVEAPTIIIGAWNLEHFHDGEVRGFPEFKGTDALPPRTDADYARIAAAIREHLNAGVMILSEIAGITQKQDSNELRKLCGILGPSWQFVIGSEGGPRGVQRVALLYDTAKVTPIRTWEMHVDRLLEQGTDIFDRDPLVGYFRANLPPGSAAANGTDFLVVALHLASGQEKNTNHNAAMEVFRKQLHTALAHDPDLITEKDVLFGGDMNSSRFDRWPENYWYQFDATTTSNPDGLNIVTLAGAAAEDYSATRVVGNPPSPRSYIDYLFASSTMSQKLVLPTATVHQELATNGDYYRYRVDYSDHFPVTTTLKVGVDDD